jgi:hypothetical protein
MCLVILPTHEVDACSEEDFCNAAAELALIVHHPADLVAPSSMTSERLTFLRGSNYKARHLSRMHLGEKS